jgi:hypothetical protein
MNAQTNFRPRIDQRAWLDYYSKRENRSLNGALGELVPEIRTEA